MNNGCEYRSVCKKAFSELSIEDINKNPFLTNLYFYVNYAQTFGPCSTGNSNCKIKKMNRNFESKYNVKSEDVHATFLKGVLKEI